MIQAFKYIVLDYERLNVVSTVFVCLYVVCLILLYLCGNYLFLCIDVKDVCTISVLYL